MSATGRPGGPIAYMARHPVAANLLMALLILGGLVMAGQTRQEVFPEFELDRVTVSIALPGASPDEVERSVVLAVEGAISDLAGVREVSATAREGAATISAELDGSRDPGAVRDAIAEAVAAIDTFPDEAEEPSIRLAEIASPVMELVLHGQVDRHALRMAAERLRTELAGAPGVSRVELAREQDLEIRAEIPQGRLRALDLTLGEVAQVVRDSARDRAAGVIETVEGDLAIRLEGRPTGLDGLASVPVISDATGTVLRLGDIARLSRDFEGTDREAMLDGAPAIALEVMRVGDQTPVALSEAVRRALPEAMRDMPDALDVLIVDDDSEIFAGRMELLVTNGLIGLVLVLLLLGLFLEARLAFWVAMGIPTAFLGSFLLIGPAGASINMVTMFAFILALGIVVDDAIVVGENIHDKRMRGIAPVPAAIAGTREIAVPLAFSILTNIAAFLPLAMVPGTMGKFFFWIPVVVASAFLLSWLEALFVLPGHIAAIRARPPGPPGRLARVQGLVSGGLEAVIARGYAPLLRMALNWRYATAAAMIGAAAIVLAVPLSGQMGFSLFPPVPRDTASLTLTLPVDAPMQVKRDLRARMTAAAEEVIASNGGDSLARGVFSELDGNRLRADIYLSPPDERPIPPGEVTRAWREALGPVPQARAQRFTDSFGGPGGQTSLEVALSHPDSERLRAAAGALVARLEAFEQVRDPDDGFEPGKPRLDFRLTEAGRALGLTAEGVGAQVRAALFGVEALSWQEGRNAVALRLSLPEDERDSEGDLDRLLIATPSGGAAPLNQVARVERGRAPARIEREDGRRTVTVTANVSPDSGTPAIARALREDILPRLSARYPGLDHVFGGRQEATRETAESFRQVSMPLTLGLMFALLAIPFRSYVQPVIVLAAVPFGAVGAVLGHMIMGMSLSMVSVFGMIALSGVVINAAIVMIDRANTLRREGADAFEAIRLAGIRRFRPILLTTLTTFGGLAPMIFETEAQARFLIPMAVSLGYGLLFATLIVMLFIPALYLIAEDLRWLANPRPRRVEAR